MIDQQREYQLLSTYVSKRLPNGYLLSQHDIMRLNYVHLVSIGMFKDDTAKTMPYGEVTKAAIEWLTIDKGLRHPDPYELWIDAGVLDKNLNTL